MEMIHDYPRFELVSQFADQTELLPKRATKFSAGYDFVVAQDTVVSSHTNITNLPYTEATPASFDEMAKFTKSHQFKPTLVPTGVKAYLPEGTFLQLSVRSSCPLKSWLVLANGVGIIDGDYYNNPDNEGHIFFQIINLSPADIILHKGDKIGQGIILPYFLAEGDTAAAARTGGFGSTSK